MQKYVQEDCSQCDATGRKYPADLDSPACLECRGTGKVTVKKDIPGLSVVPDATGHAGPSTPPPIPHEQLPVTGTLSGPFGPNIGQAPSEPAVLVFYSPADIISTQPLARVPSGHVWILTGGKLTKIKPPKEKAK